MMDNTNQEVNNYYKFTKKNYQDRCKFEFLDVTLTGIYQNGDFYLELEKTCNLLSLNQTECIRFAKDHILKVRPAPCEPEVRSNIQSHYLIRLDIFLLWLATIDTESSTHNLRTYKAEAAIVLQEAFLTNRFGGESSLAELLQHDTVAVRAFKEALTLLYVTHQHILQESQNETYTIQHQNQNLE